MSYEEDVRFVGAFVRGGDWEVGLRVARNVVGSGQVRGIRVSKEKFSEDSGLSVRTVIRYYEAWQAAAADSYVDPAESLMPDDEYDWTDEHTKERWDSFYSTARYGSAEPEAPKRPPTKSEVTQAIKNNPEIARSVVAEAIKSDPAVITETIKSNPKARNAARKAIREVDAEAVDQDDVDSAEVLDYTDEREYRMVEAKSKIRSASILLGRAAEDLLGFDPTEDVVQVMKDHMVKAELLQARISCGSIDNELVALLESNEA